MITTTKRTCYMTHANDTKRCIRKRQWWGMKGMMDAAFPRLMVMFGTDGGNLCDRQWMNEACAC